jgi:hypothetical protein
MSDNSFPSSIEFNADDFETFAFIVDGEVAAVHSFHKESMPGHCAALDSDPKVVKIPTNLFNQVVFGWTYINGEFRPGT